MTIIHVLMAILAAWRLTEIITQDVIFNKPRQWWLNRFAPKDYANFLTCPRCVSVWAGSTATIAFYFAPFLNWPFALSMVFILSSAAVHHWNTARQRKIIIMPDLQRVEWGMYQVPHGLQIMRELIQNMQSTSQAKSPISTAAAPVGANGNR